MATFIRLLACVGILIAGLPQMSQAQTSQDPPGQQQPSQPQEPAPPQAPPATTEQTVTSADVSDQEVEQFARSFEDIVEIQQETKKQLESVQDTAEIERVKQEANVKMAEAIQDQGMKVERFNLISRSLNQDATLKQRVQDKIQELREEPA